jgi:hypothetical protein
MTSSFHILGVTATTSTPEFSNQDHDNLSLLLLRLRPSSATAILSPRSMRFLGQEQPLLENLPFVGDHQAPRPSLSAARWRVDKIFNPCFLAGVVRNFSKTNSEVKPSDGYRWPRSGSNRFATRE